MKRLNNHALVASTLALILLLSAVACRASWLHGSFTGSFDDGGYEYTVNNDGTIVVTTANDFPSIGDFVHIVGNSDKCVYTQTIRMQGVSLKNEAALKQMIKNLQKVESAYDDANKYCPGACK